MDGVIWRKVIKFLRVRTRHSLFLYIFYSPILLVNFFLKCIFNEYVPGLCVVSCKRIADKKLRMYQ